MDMSTIAGWLLGGLATRLYAAGAAVWIGLEAMKPLASAAHAVSRTLSVLP